MQSRCFVRFRALMPGLPVRASLAVTAAFLPEHHSAPVMLFAVLALLLLLMIA